MLKFLFFICTLFLTFSSGLYAGEDESVGEPVMSPGLNAYIPELGEKKYKVAVNTGLMHASYGFEGKDYMIMGAAFYVSALSIFETGFYANFSLGGRNENIITTGMDLRMHLIPVKFMELLYVKFGIGMARFHRGLYIGRGLEIPFGLGMQIATGQNTVIAFEYARRPIFFTTGPSVFDLMLSVGYAW